MRVIINQQTALGFRTGVGHYTAQLLESLRRQAGDNEIAAFPDGCLWWAGKAWSRIRPYLEAGTEPPARNRCALRRGTDWIRGRALYGFRRSGRTLVGRSFRAACAKQSFDLYHEPNFIPHASDCPTVATLHDLSVLVHPEWHSAERVAYFETHFQRAVGQCAHFLVVSDFTRREVMRMLNIPAEKVTRTYNGIRPGLRPMAAAEVAPILRQLGLPAQYLLYLGTLEPRKNILTLLRAYCALPSAVRTAWPLLLVGGWGWKTAAIADYLLNEGRHRGIIHLGYVPEQYLSAIYNGARALVYPSFYEGFGFPPIEMMACGGAVLTSTAGALVETVGARAHMVDPDDLDGWRAALFRVVRDQDWWQSLRRGTTLLARQFTWERCGADTLEVYHSLCEPRIYRPAIQVADTIEADRAA
jgi:alpha-1,3-rhamnosyl/mannosyltransferase